VKAQFVPHGGNPALLGATVTAEGVNFAVYSEAASAIYVCLFDDLDREIGRYELDGHDGNIHHGLIAGIGAGTLYGLRADGQYDPPRGLHFDPAKLLLDPYARRIDRPFERSPLMALPRPRAIDSAPEMPKAIVPGARAMPAAPRRRLPQLLYELNVRGYTIRHPGVAPALRGTLAALGTRPVIDHLKRIGVEAVELMPVGAFIDDAHLPALGLGNAWGYNPVGYFALDPRLAPGGPQELRQLTDLYRSNGMSVILDVVYNHTGEGDGDDGVSQVLSLKGLDALAYYRHVEVDGRLQLVNDTGTGNTLRCDHPAVQRLVIDSLRYWIEETGVSGFRFDLAPILGRDPGFDPDAMMLEMIKADPLIGKAMLIAEPWDPGPGGYQLGQFGKEFHEWNDTYRDDVRAFWQGSEGRIGALASKVAGSSEIFHFGGRRPSAGVNFLAVHDGFTLADLVSYVDKHNETNGERNRDGHDNNYSWNCGVEGPTDDEAIVAARRRDVRALLATLFVSRGTLLLQQGDEFGRTQRGNNNAYAQDNETTWVDWVAGDRGLVEFVGSLRAFRQAHPALSRDTFLSGHERHGHRDVVWLHPEGREMTEADWHARGASVLGMHLSIADDEVLVWFNRRAERALVRLPTLAAGWTIGMLSEGDAETVLTSPDAALLPPRSVVALLPGQ